MYSRAILVGNQSFLYNCHFIRAARARAGVDVSEYTTIMRVVYVCARIYIRVCTNRAGRGTKRGSGSIAGHYIYKRWVKGSRATKRQRERRNGKTNGAKRKARTRVCVLSDEGPPPHATTWKWPPLYIQGLAIVLFGRGQVHAPKPLFWLAPRLSRFFLPLYLSPRLRRAASSSSLSLFLLLLFLLLSP